MCQQGYTAQSLATVASSYSGSSLRELRLELVEGAKLLVNGGAQLARGLAGILARCRHAEPACTRTRGESGGSTMGDMTARPQSGAWLLPEEAVVLETTADVSKLSAERICVVWTQCVCVL